MLSTLPSALASAEPPVVVDVTVSTAGGVPFEHRWKRSFGSGHASLTLRPDWRSHLTTAAAELGLAGVRYHGLFDDDMSVVTAPGAYDFTAIDSTWDFLLSAGVRPIVELSFMPAFVANCSWHGHCKENPLGCEGYWCTQCNGQGVGPIVNPTAPACKALEFHYQGIKQLPPDLAPWYDLVYATVAHAVQRYGLPEVQRWSFEVWNELWGVPFPQPYLSLYNASARAVKAVHPSLLVGGPATAVLEHVQDFAQACREADIPYDFVSTHHYPTDGGSQFAGKCPKGDAWEPGCFEQQVTAARASVGADRFYLTEYNVGCCLGYPLHDTPAAAAFVFRTVGSLNELLDVYSYWTFTDVFEEGGLPREEFKDVYGLMSVRGLRKPGWRAFELLHAHAGDTRLPTAISNQSAAPHAANANPPAEAGGAPASGSGKPVVSAFATMNASSASGGASSSSVRAFLSHWGNPDTPKANATSRRLVRLTLRHAEGAAPSAASLLVVDPSTTDPRAAWEAMGSPAAPNAAQRAALEKASQVGTADATVAPLNATASLVEVSLRENSAVVVVFS